MTNSNITGTQGKFCPHCGAASMGAHAICEHLAALGKLPKRTEPLQLATSWNADTLRRPAGGKPKPKPQVRYKRAHAVVRTPNAAPAASV